MSHPTLDKKPAPLLSPGDYYNRLALVSDVLHYMAHDGLDFSTSATLGMSDILNEVADAIKPTERRTLNNE